MKYLTDYYKFERIATKAKSRLDCTLSTESYPDFEDKRVVKGRKETPCFDATKDGALVIYYNDVPMRFGGDVHRKADKNITIKGKNFSSVYCPDPATNYGFGDYGKDALLFVFTNMAIADNRIEAGSVLEIFIARGQAKNQTALYNLLTDGELYEEMQSLRNGALLNR